MAEWKVVPRVHVLELEEELNKLESEPGVKVHQIIYREEGLVTIVATKSAPPKPGRSSQSR
jgi:hypothetical protein